MSRTVRRLLLSYPIDSTKWYRHVFKSSDYNVLRDVPKIRDHPTHVWVRKTYVGTKTVEITEQQYDEEIKHGRYGVSCDFGFDDCPMKFHKYVKYTYETWSRERNPNFDQDARDEYHRWLRVHKEVYRNGSCRRQRIHAAALAKRLYHKQKRSQGRVALRGLLREYEIEDQS